VEWGLSGITGFTVTAQAEVGRTAQLSLFEPPAQSPDAVATTIARLAALIGPERVGCPKVVDRHDPERYAMGPYEIPGEAPLRRPTADTSPVGRGQRVAVRVLRPAIELEAVLDEHGTPIELKTIRLRREQPGLAGHVRVASGPWKLERRNYWDVELSDGALYRIYEDAAGRWFADGIYD
jgi:protein ImuB